MSAAFLILVMIAAFALSWVMSLLTFQLIWTVFFKKFFLPPKEDEPMLGI